MANFINTQHKTVLNSMIDIYKSKIDNPYYLYMDSKPTVVTYYSQNKEKSTLDDALHTNYSPLGKDSPLRFDKINDFYLYGLDRIITNLDDGEWGIEADTIEGEAIILPNTIVPVGNDYFIIDYLKEKKLLFQVLSSSFDTIDNGANLYKITYKLSTVNDDVDKIEKQIVEEYNMVTNNLGTEMSNIIKIENYNYIEDTEAVLDKLREYYLDIFYTQRVQTFILPHNGRYFYDPYLINFIKKNNLMIGKEYVYIAHQTYLQQSFGLDYDKTFFRVVEKGDMYKGFNSTTSQAKIIQDATSIFTCRKEDYFKIEYITGGLINYHLYIIENFDKDLMKHIKDYELYTEDSHKYKNIIIKYFNNTTIEKDDINAIEDIDYSTNIELFYNIPIIIFILEKDIVNKLLKK